jgi:preprotein translocase subunit Sec63
MKFVVLLALAVLAYLYFTGQLAARRAPGLGLTEARDILGVGADAGADEIRAAHRRLVAQVHPDKGGTAELTRRVNAARDVLLDALNRTPPRAS